MDETWPRSRLKSALVYVQFAAWTSMAHCIPTYMLASGLISAGMNGGALVPYAWNTMCSFPYC